MLKEQMMARYSAMVQDFELTAVDFVQKILPKEITNCEKKLKSVF